MTKEEIEQVGRASGEAVEAMKGLGEMFRKMMTGMLEGLRDFRYGADPDFEPFVFTVNKVVLIDGHPYLTIESVKVWRRVRNCW